MAQPTTPKRPAVADSSRLNTAEQSLIRQFLAQHQSMLNIAIRVVNTSEVPADRELAQTLADDNRQLIAQFTAFAERHHLKIGAKKGAGAPRKAISDSVGVDRSWRSRFRAIHQRELSNLRKQVSQIHHPQLKQLVLETLPFEEMHLTLLGQ